MKSHNFEFLRERASTLVDIVALAEKYWHSDPESSAVKLRAFAEGVVEGLYRIQNFPRPYDANLNDLLRERLFHDSTPKVVLDHLHLLRKLGNKGAHGNPVRANEALRGLEDAFAVAKWLYVVHLGGSQQTAPARLIEPPPESVGKLEREKKKWQEERDLLEKKLQAAIDAQKAEAARAAQAEEAHKAAEVAKQLTDEQLASMAARGAKVADVLGLNEEATRRRLIDADLVAAGWDVSTNGTSTAEVGQEVAVSGLPKGSGTGGKSGNGRVDYVLWGDDGKPLAIIEAKRTSADPEKGREQARLYADVLEKEHGQRPVIFYTNGPEIYIWDDRAHGTQKAGYPPRKVYGYYSKASLETLLFRRDAKLSLAETPVDPDIAGRLYQVEAIKRVSERLENNFRRSLIVQATGTGKTRVAVSLCDVLGKARWAKRVLFLCDRKELRKQALNAFKDFLPGEPRTQVSKDSVSDTKSRMFVGIYGGVDKIYESFDVGFFDLIIADESHRSIYNKYRDIFEYFDCIQVGLTATPVKFVERNTYKLFGCEDQDPTFNYEYEDAVKAGYLVPFEVIRVTTKFLREGIKYSQMSAAERKKLEEDLDNPQLVEFDAPQVDKQIFNKDTNRHILRNLMEHGIRDGSGSLPGKTIVFARSQKHAELMKKLFDEMYPNFGGSFCKVIHSDELNAEQLIDDFKSPNNPLTIAISVDMLDTGIDVPEVVNLVFAKPVRSYVKFWQMIGRGTRLCENLFGPGQDKEAFRIFDHWDNFEYFDERYSPKEPSAQKSLNQRLFEQRIELLSAAHHALDSEVEKHTAALLLAQLNALRDTHAIAVRDAWKPLEKLASQDVIQPLHAATKSELESVVGPLLQLVSIRGEEPAYRFDLLMTRLIASKLRGTPDFDDRKAEVEEEVEALQMNLNPVKAKAEFIKKVRSKDFWESAGPAEFEDLRVELRGIMKHRAYVAPPQQAALVTDIADGEEVRERYQTKLLGMQLDAYRKRVKKALTEHFEENLVVRKIRSNIRVDEVDLENLASEVLSFDSGADIHRLLKSEEGEVVGQLYFVFKSLVGLDRKAVDEAFQGFVHNFPSLSARQIAFLDMVKSHICEHGLITVEDLDEAPFIHFDASGFDGLFPDDEMASSLLNLIATFDPANVTSDRAV